MPRDQRLYMTFPIDFHRHPKIARLSDAAFRAFVEANGESRIAESDGRIEAEDAEFMWKPDVLAELVASHPTRPVMLREGTTYVLRDYAEHQFTKADRDELREKRAKAGRASADKRAARAEHVLNGTEHPATESESELENSKTYRDQSGSNRARELTDSEGFTSKVAQRLASQAGIDDPATFARIIHDETGITVPWDRLATIVNHYADKSTGVVDKGVGYAITSIRNDREQARKFIYENGLAT